MNSDKRRAGGQIYGQPGAIWGRSRGDRRAIQGQKTAVDKMSQAIGIATRGSKSRGEHIRQIAAIYASRSRSGQ